MSDPKARLGIDCPDVGEYYSCEGNANFPFIGCCTSNPCQAKDGMCPEEDLGAMTFDADAWEDIPQQACDDSTDAQWWTCAGNDPPFVGCCIENPCAAGQCPSGNLTNARLSNSTANSDGWLGLNLDDTTTTTKSSASHTATSSSPAETTTSSDDDSGNSGLSTGGKVGAAIGAIAIGFLLAGVLFFFWRRRQKAKANNGPVHSQPDVQQQTPYAPIPNNFNNSPHSPGFVAPGSPQTYHDNQMAGFHPGMTPSPVNGQQPGSPQQGYWNSPQQQQGFQQGGVNPYEKSLSPGPGYGAGAGYSPQQQQQTFVAELPDNPQQPQASELDSGSVVPSNVGSNTMSVSSFSGVKGRESTVSALNINKDNGSS